MADTKMTVGSVAQIFRIPATAACEMIKWRLTLYQDSSALTPTLINLSTRMAYLKEEEMLDSASRDIRYTVRNRKRGSRKL